MKDILQVGEYCRTAGGRIFKVSEVETFSGCNYIPKDENKTLVVSAIVKHSFDLIDIIEEGDYVNGHKVIDASDTNKGCMREVYCEDDEDFGIWDEMIKTVVTKEQFDNISYKVKGVTDE